MNKEEIENKIKPIGELLQDKINRLSEESFKQSQYIEQLESILDKITDKLKEDIEKYNKELIKNNILSATNVDLSARVLQSQKILNIIEGGKNNEY